MERSRSRSRRSESDGAALPRDLIGYGATPPRAQWPDDARIALQFVINYEEGSENSILHGAPASEAFLSEIVGTGPFLVARQHEHPVAVRIGTRAGVLAAPSAFIARSTPVTVYGVAMGALARNPQTVAGMLDAGWEIATHGYRRIAAMRSRSASLSQTPCPYVGRGPRNPKRSI
jgi:hypothetical protein